VEFSVELSIDMEVIFTRTVVKLVHDRYEIVLFVIY
jgi:hypothetical protein